MSAGTVDRRSKATGNNSAPSSFAPPNERETLTKDVGTGEATTRRSREVINRVDTVDRRRVNTEEEDTHNRGTRNSNRATDSSPCVHPPHS